MAGIIVKAVGEVDFKDFQRAQRELDKMRRSADTLDNRIRRVGDSFGKVGRQLKQTGGTLTRYVSAPMGALGGFAVRSAMDFEVSMARIEGLVGVAASEIGELADAARTLGPSYGVSANEAGEALFFITSAGLRGATAIEALDSALKASAIGLGETAVVADLLTSAVNAYGESTLGASEATDVLVNAVRLGKLEPSELAGAMGQVLPVASAMGVEFHEVGAAFAAMSRTGTNAEVAATQLRQILATILKPSVEAEQALAGIGLSAEDLREQIREQGLLSVLQTLITRFDGNAAATSEVFGNIRALSGVLDLMGSNITATTEIFDGMSESIGVGDDAFRTVSETASQQFKVALEEAKGAMMEAATEALPVLTDLAESLQDLVQDWRNLSDEQQETYLKIAGVAAVAGPAIIVLGQLAVAVRGVASALIFLSAHPVVAGVALLGGVVVGLAAAYGSLSEAEEQAHTDAMRARAAQTEVGAAYLAVGEAARDAANNTRTYAEETRSAAREARLLRKRHEELNAEFQNEVQQFQNRAATERQRRQNKLTEEAAAAAEELANSWTALTSSYESATEKVVVLDDETVRLLRTMNESYAGTTAAGDALAEYAREVLAAGTMSESTAREVDGLASALRSELSGALSDAEAQLGTAQRAFDSYRDSIADGIRQGNTLADAFDAQTAARDALAEAEVAYGKAVQSGDSDAIAEAAYNYEQARNSAASFNDFLAQNARTAERFADQIDALRLAGASLSVVQQIAQLGAQTGGRIVAELLAGGAAAIQQANRLVAAVDEVAARAGTAAAQQFFGAGVRAGQALVEGIQSQLDAFEQVVSQMADIVERNFGTSPAANRTPAPTPSPTPRVPAYDPRVLTERQASAIGGIDLAALSNFRIPGFADGGLVLGPTLGLVGEAGPELIVPLDEVGSMGAPTTVNVTVTSADPQAVVEAIRRYTRGNGPLGQVVTL